MIEFEIFSHDLFMDWKLNTIKTEYAPRFTGVNVEIFKDNELQHTKTFTNCQHDNIKMAENFCNRFSEALQLNRLRKQQEMLLEFQKKHTSIDKKLDDFEKRLEKIETFIEYNPVLGTEYLLAKEHFKEIQDNM